MDELTLKILLAELGPALAGATASSAYRLRPGVIVLELKTRDGPRGAFTLAPGDGGATFYDADPGKRRSERVRVRTGLEGWVRSKRCSGRGDGKDKVGADL